MSLPSANIPRVKKLSFTPIVKEIALEPIYSPIEAARPPTMESIAFSNLVAINPLILSLVERLGLVSTSTDKKIETIDLSKLKERSYTREILVEWIREEARVNETRAEKGFIFMLDKKMILPTINPELYYLSGSTPF